VVYFLLLLIIAIVFILKIFYQSYSEYEDDKVFETISSNDRGTYSERLLIKQLLKNGIHPRTIFHDLLIKKENGDFTQVDLAIATTEGIIVIEVKDYKGWIFGDGKSRNWTQVLAFGKVKHKFYNPILQNKNHIKHLKRVLKQFERIPFFSLIVFYGDCEFKDVQFIPKNTYLVKAHRIHDSLERIKRENTPANYSNKKEVLDTLNSLSSLGKDIQKQNQHIANLNEMLGQDRVLH